MTPKDIIAKLREEVDALGKSDVEVGEAVTLLDQLEAALELSYWPDEVFEAAETVFGKAVYARTGRTYQALDSRIRHALRVWDERYGPLNPDQNAYSASLIVSAINRGAMEAAGDRQKLYPYVQNKIGQLVNHETVHAGFQRRATGDVHFDPAKLLATA